MDNDLKTLNDKLDKLLKAVAALKRQLDTLEEGIADLVNAKNDRL